MEKVELVGSFFAHRFVLLVETVAIGHARLDERILPLL